MSTEDMTLESINLEGIEPIRTIDGTSICPHCRHINKYGWTISQPCEHMIYRKVQNDGKGKLVFLWYYLLKE